MLLTGDFNARPDDPIRAPIAQLDWVDTWTHWNDNVGPSAVTHSGGDDARIDYVYATPALDVVADRTVATPYSDHRAVIADLRIRSTPPIAVGTVRAGRKGHAGWASLDVFSNRSARLRVCDNRPDGRGVRAWVTSGRTLLMHAGDGAYATRCAHPIAPPAAITGPVELTVCLYRGDALKDCRRRPVP